MYLIAFYDESGNHSSPYDHSDYEKVATLSAATRAFQAWVEEVGQYSDPQNATALVYHKDGLDYPEYQFTVGPRGGIHKTRM